MAFTFTINGHTYSSDPASAVPDGYRFVGYGYITALANLVQDIASVMSQQVTAAAVQVGLATDQVTLATTQAQNAAASALSAVNSPGTNATSTTAVTIANATPIAMVIQPGKSIVPGMSVIAAVTASPGINRMHGVVTAYNGGTGALNFTTDYVEGAGNFAAWTISLSAPTGAPSPAGNAGKMLVASATGDTLVFVSPNGAAGAATPGMAASVALTAAQLGSLSFTPTVAGLSVTLPDARTVNKGTSLGLLQNNSDTFSLGVRDKAGTLLTVMGPTGSVDLGLADNASLAGVWTYETTEELGALTLLEWISATGLYDTAVALFSPACTDVSSKKNTVALSASLQIAFLTSQTAGNGFLVAIDSNNVAIGTPVLAVADGSGVLNCAAVIPVSATTGILVWSNSTLTRIRAVGFSVSGVAISVGGPVTIDAANPASFLSSVVLSGGGIAIAYQNSGVSSCSMYALSLTGTAVSVGGLSSSFAGYSSYPTLIPLSATGFMSVTGGNAGACGANTYTLAGTTITNVQQGYALTDSIVENPHVSYAFFTPTRVLVSASAGGGQTWVQGFAITAPATIARTNLSSSALALGTGASSRGTRLQAYSNTQIIVRFGVTSGSVDNYTVVADSGTTISVLKTFSGISSGYFHAGFIDNTTMLGFYSGTSGTTLRRLKWDGANFTSSFRRTYPVVYSMAYEDVAFTSGKSAVAPMSLASTYCVGVFARGKIMPTQTNAQVSALSGKLEINGAKAVAAMTGQYESTTSSKFAILTIMEVVQ